MQSKPSIHTVALGAALLSAVSLTVIGARQPGGKAIPIDADDLGGVVTGAKGPEAGVWVIAETTRAPDQACQDRGDRRSGPVPRSPISQRRSTASGCAATVSSIPRRSLQLQANRWTSRPPRRRARARRPSTIPAGYWFSLLRVPPKSEFPGTGPTGNGINPNMKSQAQ